MQKKEVINFINIGAIDFYYGLKIETKLDFLRLCENINKRVEDSIKEYNDSINQSLRALVSKAICECELENKMYIKDGSVIKKNEEVQETNQINSDICDVELECTANGLNVKAYTPFHNYLQQMSYEDKGDFDYSSKVYGEFYTECQFRFVLPPVYIELNNSTEVFLTAVLIVFSNKFAVLRLTLPINNVDSAPLISCDIYKYIISAKPLYNFSESINDKTIDAIKEFYCHYLVNTKKIKNVVCFKRITNIIFAKQSYSIANIKSIPDRIKEELYKISVAPIQIREGVSYIDEAKEHFDKNAFLSNGVGYIFSSIGRCISIVDSTILDFVDSHSKEELSYDGIIRCLRREVEFSFVVLLLKNINDSDIFKQKILFEKKLSSAKKIYNSNKIFISVLQNSVYGSVRDLTEFIENSMAYFLDIKNVQERILALDSILEEEQAERSLQLQNIISIGGLIFTIMFGLPAINETLSYVRKLCFFIMQDVPYLSVENCSFVIWIVMVAVFVLFIFSKLKRKKSI